MDFVEHDVTDEVETSGILVDQVAQDLGSHHDDGRVEAEGQGALEFGDQWAGGLLAYGVHSWISSVVTSVIRAPSLFASMKDSAAARTLSAWRPSPLTVAMASSASCHRSSSPTSAAVTFSSWRSRRSSPLTTCRLDLSDPESGRCSTTRATPIATLQAITICF